ncbi:MULTISPECIES: RecQ family ATP-dependent DNA helicase [Peribacillus]|uniref:RecQ family ATP-dependent DNA helicase n=1 Tax=Peribacillus TaxID=2675229 RepID=UPI001F4E13C2|nr:MULTISPECIES: ATP-dependent DNA helicase RecQ [unclassified Peribacillus]MCK1982396.1 ATP-dependent DNA helicase [Peribacillus sp. Aquil_B1]MCK2009435.1 ATP-dependent DNA helicase [Peribacillus sp. Aquil_B8]
MKIERVLKEKFGFDEFRPGQKEVVESLMSGNHTLAMLPTGSGKSLCYQLPAYLLNKTVLIVSPLLSLMQDQAEQLKMSGEKSVLTLNSFLTLNQKRKAFDRLHSYRFIFLSPEMLSLDGVIKSLKSIDIGLFVIDEAHCISQWGYDFRPDYLNLGEVRRELSNPLTLALTATATDEVRRDIVGKLNIEPVKETVSSVDRENIAIIVERMFSYDEKLARVLELVRKFTGSGIIYFSSKKVAESVTGFLQENGIESVNYYHGGMEQEQRMLIQQQFISGQLKIICATSAFGMGVNKSDVRYVIHFHIPSTMEAYLQEIGRAGRDRKQSVAVLLYSEGDEGLPLHLMEQQLPTDSQIDGVCSFLDASQKIPMNLTLPEKEQLSQSFSLNEIQLRFFTQFIAGNSLHQVAEMKEYCQKRKSSNQEKLHKFLHWIYAQECRRLGILDYFGEKHREVNPICCDNCGMDTGKMADVWPEVKVGPVNSFSSWKKELAYILLKKENGNEK